MPRQVTVVTSLSAALVLTGCAAPGTPDAGSPTSPGFVTLEPMPDEPPVLEFDDALDPSEMPVLPIPSADVYAFMEGVQGLAGDSPDNGGPALSDDRTTVTLYWFGTVPDDVRALIAEYEDRVQVAVVPTPYRPGDLRAEAERLIREYASTVQAVGPRPQGDGIDVLVDEGAAQRAGGLDAALDDLDSPFPLFGEVGGVVPL